MSIDNRLKHVLVDKNMSIKQLSERTGITYSIIYDFANMRRRSLQWDVLEAVCNELGIVPGDIIVLKD